MDSQSLAVLLAVRMLPTRLSGTFRQVVLPPAAAHRQRVGQVAAAALILALAALSIRLTLATDYVARFSHMGYVGGIVMNAIASATIFYLNLDALSLRRDPELQLQLEDSDTAATLTQDLFVRDIRLCRQGVPDRSVATQAWNA